MTKNIKTDVLIIGAGLGGSAIARQLSKYDVDTLLIEKEVDLCQGISKTGHGYIYTGAEMAFSMSAKGRLDLDSDDPELDHIQMTMEGYGVTHQMLHDLDVKHEHNGSLVIATKDEELSFLEQLAAKSKEVHVVDPEGVQLIDNKTIHKIEPYVTEDAIQAVYDPECIIDLFPPEFVIALAENAMENGVRLMTDTEALAFSHEGDTWTIETNKGVIEARFVLNVTGHDIANIADIAGERDEWDLHFLRLQMTLFDKRAGKLINNHLRFPFDKGKLVNLSPIHNGKAYMANNLLMPAEKPFGNETTKESFDFAFSVLKSLVPAISEDDVITSWVGIPMGKHGPAMKNNNMQSGKDNPTFISVTPMMPAIAPAPLMAAEVVNHLGSLGLPLVEKDNFIDKRSAVPRFKDLSDEEKDSLISQDSRFGSVICRCETITEGEIVRAIERGAKTVQGVKFRVRASMGRCQANFCGRKILDILARELGKSQYEIMEKDRESLILAEGGVK